MEAFNEQTRSCDENTEPIPQPSEDEVLDQKLSEVHIDPAAKDKWDEWELKLEAMNMDVLGQRAQAINYIVWKVDVKQLLEDKMDAAVEEVKRLLKEVKSLNAAGKATLWQFVEGVLF